jgi:hypothetical protein
MTGPPLLLLPKGESHWNVPVLCLAALVPEILFSRYTQSSSNEKSRNKKLMDIDEGNPHVLVPTRPPFPIDLFVATHFNALLRSFAKW